MTRVVRAGRSRPRSSSPVWVFSCEHGGYALPRSYGTLGLAREDLRDHIGWDIGAAGVMKEAARRMSAPAVASRYSRLLVDCNRQPGEASLIPEVSDGRRIPGNERISAAERRRRIELYHEPYHARVDRMIERTRARSGEGEVVQLLSVHSFTPAMNGRTRPYDMGVLFDDHVPLARRLGAALKRRGFRVRYNEPYSGYEGLIFAARHHGIAHGIPYVELEVNNALIRTEAGCRRVGRELAQALRAMR